MIFVDYDPSRPNDEGQFYLRLVSGELGEARRSHQLGYWCDEAHLEQCLKAAAYALGQAREARAEQEAKAEREKLAAEFYELAGNRAPHLSDEENRIWSQAYTHVANRIRFPERYSGCEQGCPTDVSPRRREP